MVISEIGCITSLYQILRCEPKLNTHWFLKYLFKYLFCFIPKLSFKFIENITQCTEKLKRTFLAFQFRYLLIWHKNRRCDATCIFDECSDKELFFHRAAQNHLKVFKKYVQTQKCSLKILWKIFQCDWKKFSTISIDLVKSLGESQTRKWKDALNR